MNRPVKEEYAMLRGEVMETMKNQNSLSTFVTTTICTFIGIVIALNQPNPVLYLIPFIVLVPAALKESDYRERIAYLASYQIAYLEGEDSFLWETRYHKFATKQKPNFLSRCQDLFETLEFCLLGILCYLLFLFQYKFQCFSDNAIPLSTTMKECILLILPPILIFIIARNTLNYWNFRKVIESDIDRWKNLDNDDNSDNHTPSSSCTASASSRVR